MSRPVYFAFVAPVLLALAACSEAAPDTGRNADDVASRQNAADNGDDKDKKDGKDDEGTSKDKETETGKECGGPENVRCAKGYVCMNEDGTPTDFGEASVSGKCEKDPCITHPEECSDEDPKGGPPGGPPSTTCEPNATVYCRCTNGDEGTMKCSSDGMRPKPTACQCRS